MVSLQRGFDLAGDTPVALAPPVLRDYQRQAIEHVRRTLTHSRRTYFTLPTGCGKTVVISQLAGGYGRALLIAHRIELVDQIAGRLRSDHTASTGIVMAGQNAAWADLVVATPQTLRSDRLAQVAAYGQIDALFIDEAHHAVPGSRYEEIVEQLEQHNPELHVIGCTATPFRHDKKRMQGLIPVCAFSRTIDDMQRAGYLCPLVWRPIQVDMDLSRLHTTNTSEGRDYVLEELAVEAEQPDVVDAVIARSAAMIGDRPTLVFGCTVNHAQLLAEAFSQAGYTAAAIWGEMRAEDRKRVLADWRAGRIQVVTNCAVLTEGFDFPEISALVIARPTQSPSLYVQMVGRATRTHAGKTDALIIDVSGNEPIDETKQVVLADVAEVDLPDLDGDEPIPDGEKPPKIRMPSKRLLVRDPSHDEVYRWIRDETGYLLSAADGVMLVMLADPAGSGLYQLGALEKSGRIQRVTDHPDSIWEQQRHALEWLAQNSVPVLSTRQQKWHDKPASEKQLAYLARLDRGAAQRIGAATRGAVSEAIAQAVARRHRRGLEIVLWRNAA